ETSLPVEIVNARPDRVASALAFFASNEQQTRAILKRGFTLFEPFAYSLFLEVCSIVAFGFAFGSSRRRRVEPASVPGTSASPTPPGPGMPKIRPKPAKPRGKGGRKADPKVIEFSEQFFRKFGRQPTGSEIKSEFPDLPKSTAYDYAAR